ncbi:MAG: DsrE/DsrF/DrsH-like family protein [Thermoplasmata archaeon]
MSSAILPPVVAHDEHALSEVSAEPTPTEPKIEGLSIILFSGDLDKALAAFTIANGAAAMDLPVTMFFTFWGLNVLRREEKVRTAEKKTTMEGMFGRMMPHGPKDLQVSKLRMGGLGTRLIRREMAKKHVAGLDALLRSAKDQNVRFIACTMSMNLMGIKKEELIDGISYGNVGAFVDAADRSRITLFI